MVTLNIQNLDARLFMMSFHVIHTHGCVLVSARICGSVHVSVSVALVCQCPCTVQVYVYVAVCV
jgi:hypothetical protein